MMGLLDEILDGLQDKIEELTKERDAACAGRDRLMLVSRHDEQTIAGLAYELGTLLDLFEHDYEPECREHVYTACVRSRRKTLAAALKGMK